MKIQHIKNYIEWRKAVWPTGKDALDFAVTEIGEAVDAWLRKYRSDYLRNSPDKDSDIGLELSDCYQMLEIASHELTGKSLDENLRMKWARKGYTIPDEISTSDNFRGILKAWDKDRFGTK